MSRPNLRILIWGRSRPNNSGGWIAGLLDDLALSQGKDVHCTDVRMENMDAVGRVLDDIKPDCVINCAGKTGRPNIDWCEDHKRETMESNAIGTLVLANECARRGLHLTVLATGCIYHSDYTPDHSTILSAPIPESSPPNFTASFYSHVKAHIEALLTHYPHTLVLRVRMPVSDDLHPRSFVTKIKSYAHVVNIPNSHTILPELLPMALALAEHREVGVMNFTNPGAATHNEVLGLYRDIVEPGFKWENFTLEQQGVVVKAARSNCELDVGRLMGKVEQYRKEGVGVEVNEIHVAYRKCFERMKAAGRSEIGAVRGC